MTDNRRFQEFVAGLGRLLNATENEEVILRGGRRLLERLVAADDWLPVEFARPDPARYSQYLLYLDPEERFSVVSFVWGPGQKTPVHDHTVWGLVGVLRGAELSQAYWIGDAGLSERGDLHRLDPGEVEAVSPRIGDIHQVANAFDDRVSISIHVYGADIGKVSRHTFPPGGGWRSFVSGYSNPDGPRLLRQDALAS
jgi:predicted metal-dependent enzyme (double-stranded beta helix superfamily)